MILHQQHPKFIRKCRHWKQRFDPNARFIFRRPAKFANAGAFEVGDLVPPDLLSPIKLRNFWEAKWIELAEFDEPINITTGQRSKEHDIPAALTVSIKSFSVVQPHMEHSVYHLISPELPDVLIFNELEKVKQFLDERNLPFHESMIQSGTPDPVTLPEEGSYPVKLQSQEEGYVRVEVSPSSSTPTPPEGSPSRAQGEPPEKRDETNPAKPETNHELLETKASPENSTKGAEEPTTKENGKKSKKAKGA